MFGRKKRQPESFEVLLARLADSLVSGFALEGVVLDYSLGSVDELDQFTDRLLAEGPPGVALRNLMLSFGAYLGEVIVRSANGSQWVRTELGDGVLTASGRVSYPMAKVAKRFELGGEHQFAQFVRAAIDPDYFAQEDAAGRVERREPDDGLPQPR